MQQTHEIWDSALIKIKDEVSEANFNTWFSGTHIHNQNQGEVIIGVPNEFVREWLNTKYYKLILKIVRDLLEDTRTIEIIVAKKKQDTLKSEPQKTTSKKAPSTLYSDKEMRGIRDNLNSRYTFDTFVVGPFNEVAYSASRAIVKQLGTYNPLYIYGQTGLGKTHLMQAIGNELKEQNPSIKINYTTSDKFTNEYVKALHNQQIDSFKKRYRSYDVLIMDDIQFLSSKEKTQEELFHLFNVLFDNNKQIIFSSDKHPNQIIGLEERLKSRFSAGMIIDVNKPEYESRVAILRNKCKLNNLDFSDDVLEFIANKVEGNIRELEGVLNSLSIYYETVGSDSFTVSHVEKFIKNSIKPKKHATIPDVVRAVADHHCIKEEKIYEKTRRKEIVSARQVVMYILRNDYDISYSHIGRELGGRDHTTVIHSCKKVEECLENDIKLHQDIDEIRRALKTI